MSFWLNLFDTSDFPARWYCGEWTRAHGLLHILSDLGIWAAYFTIPAILGYFIWQKKTLPFRRIFVLFGAFILFCGTTHLMEAIIFWWPIYRVAGLLKLATAIVSWCTIVALVRIVPTVLLMRTPEELQREIQAREKAEQELQATNAELERRVAQRTADLTRANETLQLERERLRTTLTSIGDGVITTDHEGKVTQLNRVAEVLTGWEQKDAVGLLLPEIFNIVNEQSRQPVENPALRALQEGIVVGLANHTILIAKDGTQRYIDDSAAPIRNEHDVIVGAVLIFRDITQRYEADRIRRLLAARLNSLVQNAPIGIALFDTDLRFVDINEQAAVANGIPREAHLGKTMSELLPAMGLQIETLLKQVRDTGRSFSNVEITGETAGDPGKQRYYIASYYPVRDEHDTMLAIGAVALEITDRKRSVQALQSQYDLTKAITDNATTAIFMTDIEGRCTFMNPAAEVLTGYNFAEAAGQNLHDLIHHTRPDGVPYEVHDCPLQRALPDSFEVRVHEDTFIKKNGVFFPVVCNARPILKDGRPTATVIEVTDLTEQKLAADLLRQSEARFTQLADVIPQLAWMAQPDGHIDWYNSRWYEYTGTTLEQMAGWGWTSIHDQDALPAVIEKWSGCLATGTPLDMVFPLKGADGTFRPFLSRAMPFRDEQGQIVRWFGTNTDISDQQQTQDDLRKLAARLSEADRRKDEFLATLAHELRNPLAPIRTGLEVMKMVMDDPQTLEEVRLTMERQTLQLITLVDDLLDVSRITQGKFHLRKAQVNLADIFTSAVEAARSFIEEGKHQLTVTLPDEQILLDADASRLTQVISNLLNNAAKYTPAGGQIWLSAQRQEDQLRLSVKDTGIGIPAEMLENIFEMFTQIERPIERGYTGLGIGLTLVKSLVKLHGGTVEVHSEGTNLGSEFVVYLPILTAGAPQPAGVQIQKGIAQTGEKRRVLIVDDNQEAAEMLGLVVEMLGNDVRRANDGQEALQIAAKFRPDVIIMDIGMPKMNGHEAARQIRAQPWGEKIMLIALTGWGQAEDRQKTQAAGFDFHLVKPADPVEVQRLLAGEKTD